MGVYFRAGGARDVGDEVGEVGGGLELDFAVRGGGGTRAFEGVAFVDGGHVEDLMWLRKGCGGGGGVFVYK